MSGARKSLAKPLLASIAEDSAADFTSVPMPPTHLSINRLPARASNNPQSFWSRNETWCGCGTVLALVAIFAYLGLVKCAFSDDSFCKGDGVNAAGWTITGVIGLLGLFCCARVLCENEREEPAPHNLTH